MKKLITIMAAAVSALFAFGDLPSGTSVEAYTGALRTDKNDAGTKSDSTYWFLDGNAEESELLVTNYESGVKLPPCPAQFSDAGNNFLKIETSGRLYRSIAANDQTTSFTTADIGNGLYLDTLINFETPSSDLKNLTLAGEGASAIEDKIAITLFADDDENSADYGETNFVIRAGYLLSGGVDVTNYVAKVPDGFYTNDWHRLTVRAVASIADGVSSGSEKVGFIVYVDGEALEYKDSTVECGDGFTPTAAVSEYYKSGYHAIYPSAVQTGGNRSSLSAVAFNGNGSIDAISFTDQTPGFIGRTVTFDLGSGDAVTTLTVAGTDYDVTGVATTNIENLVETFTIAVTPAENYNIEVITNFAGCAYAPTTKTSGIVTLTAASATVKVLTSRDNFDYIDANGDPKTAVTLADALANVGDGETIALKFDYVLADWGEAGVTYDIDGKAVTIDLHGNTIEGGIGEEDTELFYVEAGAVLTVIDSVGGGEVSYATSYGIFYAEGELAIGAATGDAGATFNGTLFVTDAEGTVIRGSFDVANNGNSGSFLWEDYLGSGSTSELNQAGTYWVVTPQNTPQPTTYEVTWTLTGGTTTATSGDDFAENDEIVFTAESGKTLSFVEIDGVEDTSAYGASSYTYTVGTADAELVVTFTGQVAVPTAETGLVYDGTAKVGVVADTGYTLTGNVATNAGNYTATATLEQGYVWSDGTTEAKSINWSIAADTNATVVVALTSEIAEWTDQLDFPAATATIGDDAVVGTAAWSPDTITEPAAGATNTYTATFTVTSGNYAGSTGTAEFKVWKAAQSGGYPSYIPEDAAVKAKYDAWKETYGADTGSVHEDAFLLNIAPDAVDQTLEPTSITISGGKIVIDANKDLDAVNGKVYIKTSATLSGLASATWSQASLDASGAIEMTSDGTAAFFKIKVDF